MMREIAEINGVKKRLLKTEDVAKAIAAQAERPSQMEDMQMAQQGASAMKDVHVAGVSADQAANAAGSVPS